MAARADGGYFLAAFSFRIPASMAAACALSFVERRAGLGAGALVADVAEPGIVENFLALIDQGINFRVESDRLVRLREAPCFEHDFGENAVAGLINVHAVFGHGEGWLLFAPGGDIVVDRSMQVDGGSDTVTAGLLKDPGGIAGDDFLVVVLVDGFPRVVGAVLFRQQPAGFTHRLGIEGRRGHQHQCGAGGFDLVDEPLDPVLVGGKALLTEGMIDAVIHSVAGDDEIRLALLKGTIESLVNIGSRERVVRLGLAGKGFTGQAEVDQFGQRVARLGDFPEMSFDEG